MSLGETFKDDGSNQVSLRDAINAVFAQTGRKQRSVLDGMQVVAVTQLFVFADHFKSVKAKLLAETLMEIKVSEKARGRDDMVEAIRSALMQNKQDGDLTMRRRLLGF